MTAHTRIGGPADAGRDAAGRNTHWSLRSMARASGHNDPRPFIASGGPSACSRIARRPSSLSSDQHFLRGPRSATSVGLYPLGTPPDREPWYRLWLDEKSQIQAAEILVFPAPLCRIASPGMCGAAQPFDYKRHGTTWSLRGPRHQPRERCILQNVSLRQQLAAREFRKGASTIASDGRTSFAGSS